MKALMHRTLSMCNAEASPFRARRVHGLEWSLKDTVAGREIEIDTQMARDLHGLAVNGAEIILRQQKLEIVSSAKAQMQTLIDDCRSRLQELCDLEVARLVPEASESDDQSNVVPLDAFRNSHINRR